VRLGAHVHQRGDAGTAQAAITARVLGEILLVVVLGVVELGGVEDLGGHRWEAGLGELLLVALARGQRRLLLRLIIGIDTGAVLGADVVALAHALGRVVRLEKCLEQLRVAQLLRVEHHAHHLVVPGAPAAHFLITGIGRVAAGITNRGHEHPRQLPKALLRAPETAKPEERQLQTRRIGRR
jgi:hypothetical protein